MIRFGMHGHPSTRISFFTFTKEHIILCTFPLSYEPLFTSRGHKKHYENINIHIMLSYNNNFYIIYICVRIHVQNHTHTHTHFYFIQNCFLIIIEKNASFLCEICTTGGWVERCLYGDWYAYSFFLS